MTDCPLCDADGQPLTRRSFLRQAGIVAATAVLPWELAAMADAAAKAPETLSRELYMRIRKSNERMLQMMTHPADTPMRKQVHANWDISKVRIGDLPNAERALAIKILEQSVSRDAYRRFRKQMRYDSEGIANYSIGFLATPGHPQFQYMMAGRHFTLRIDGKHDDQIALGGPILYGHAEERRAELNIWHHHRVEAQGMFRLMTGPQQQDALVAGRPPNEFDLNIRKEQHRQGISLTRLKAGQLKEVVRILRSLLGMYGPKPLAEIDRIVGKNGGWNKMHLGYYKDADQHNDKVWDVWRVEGPGFMYFFRGTPHVHAYLNIFEA